jgi:hypothetical protein
MHSKVSLVCIEMGGTLISCVTLAQYILFHFTVNLYQMAVKNNIHSFHKLSIILHAFTVLDAVNKQ